MTEAYIFDAVRTPRGKGKKDGGLHQATPIWLLRTLLQALQQRNRLDTSLVDDVVSRPWASRALTSPALPCWMRVGPRARRASPCRVFAPRAWRP